MLVALVAAYLFGIERKAQPPVFTPVSSPYASAIYANGIVESNEAERFKRQYLSRGFRPDHKGAGARRARGAGWRPLFTIDDSVQRATTEQLRLQAEASLALLGELKAQPRAETLAVAKAQVAQAESSLKVARDQYDKTCHFLQHRPQIDQQGRAGYRTRRRKAGGCGNGRGRRQYELTKAGAWSYDIVNQQKQYEALKQAYQAANDC